MIRRLRAEDGFTLTETLVACVLGMFILGAAGGLLSMATTSHKTTTARIQAVQNGRLVMDLITSRLRSQICIGPADSTRPGEFAALQAAGPDSVTFYSSLSSAPTRSGMLQVDKRTLSFVPTGAGSDLGAIVEEIRPGTQTSVATTPTFPVAPASTRTLATGVSRAAPGAPIFRYRRYDSQASPLTSELVPPITPIDRELVVRIDVAFDAYPDGGGEKRLRTVYADQAFVRTADPLDPTRSPKCI